MVKWAVYKDGTKMDENIFRILAEYSPSGVFDVFASDQHNSYLKLASSFLKHIGEDRKATDSDVTEICRRFSKHLKGNATAALFNQLAFDSPNFRELLGKQVMLIGRLENTNAIPVDNGIGLHAQLSINPEDCADKVDAFKTLVKLNPNHEESWEYNRNWLKDVFERCKKIGRPLFNETLIFKLNGETKADMAKRLPDALIKIAEDFGRYGHFYKTQVPLLWVEENGKITKTGNPKVIRKTAERMYKIVPRPMLLLSAAVDFEQYSAQYGIVSDLFTGPMCGRAYFKEVFTGHNTKDWNSLEDNFKNTAIPRIKQIRSLARIMGKPWWDKFTWISEEAKNTINKAETKKESVKADQGC